VIDLSSRSQQIKCGHDGSCHRCAWVVSFGCRLGRCSMIQHPSTAFHPVLCMQPLSKQLPLALRISSAYVHEAESTTYGSLVSMPVFCLGVMQRMLATCTMHSATTLVAVLWCPSIQRAIFGWVVCGELSVDFAQASCQAARRLAPDSSRSASYVNGHSIVSC